MNWSRWQELNPQPEVYKTPALPLSYTGFGARGRNRTYKKLILSQPCLPIVPLWLVRERTGFTPIPCGRSLQQAEESSSSKLGSRKPVPSVFNNGVCSYHTAAPMLAEGDGVEPPRAFASSVFKTGAVANRLALPYLQEILPPWA